MQCARLVLLYLSVNESCFLTSELNGFGIGIEYQQAKRNSFLWYLHTTTLYYEA
jgi:hypothetical protein